MNEKIITPCKDVCRYEDIEGTPTCISCFRTYDDLDKWAILSNHERKERIKDCKKRKKKYYGNNKRG